MAEPIAYAELLFAYEREKKARLESEQILQTLTRRMYKVNEELRASAQELHNHQRTAIQQEKLAAIGRLTAGVAHEVNNPLAFAMANLDILQQYNHIFTLIISRARQQSLSEEAILAIVQAQFPRKSIDFLAEDAKCLIDETTQGLERVKEIVANLKTFSRSDDDTRLLHNVNVSIKAAVNMLSNELQSKCNLRLTLGEFPDCYCNPNHITQIMMNLLDNALDALNEQPSPEILIRSFTTEDDLVVEVSDNGVGISDATKKNLFLPFFTTKPFGQGTGLGLSICYDKAQNMGGRIECESTLGIGTKFRLFLPLECRKAAR